MMVFTSEIRLKTQGAGDIQDITSGLQRAVGESGITDGTITAFCPGSTGGITTLEFEPGLLQDLPEFFEKLIPSDRTYKHDETWHDGNGFSHLRAALVGPDITIPICAGVMALGTWQQVVFLEFDNKARERRLIVQIIGE
ncbi:MAG: secondary thiamine-phosphate synthase enzyme YjbQ [bacterium]